MRELFLKMSMSVDGFVSDLEGRNTWMFGSDQAAKAWSVETVSNASLHIMGHRTFAEMAAYWPTSTDQFAPPMNRIPKAVFARRLGRWPAAVLQPASTSPSQTTELQRLSGRRSCADVPFRLNGLCHMALSLYPQPRGF